MRILLVQFESASPLMVVRFFDAFHTDLLHTPFYPIFIHKKCSDFFGRKHFVEAEVATKNNFLCLSVHGPVIKFTFEQSVDEPYLNHILRC